MAFRLKLSVGLTALMAYFAAGNLVASERATPVPEQDLLADSFLNQPLVTHMYTADPSAHVFDGTIYIYPSHDIETHSDRTDDGSHFAMRDYHVFSLTGFGDSVVDHGVALSIEQVLWASKQMWAPDAAEKNGRYYLYFPAKDHQGVFRVGVASSPFPYGPFKPEPTPMEGVYSIDPSVFEDDDGVHYLYVGGIWGGQLQRWTNGQYHGDDVYPAENEPALMPLVARLSDDMLSIDEPLQPVMIVDEKKQPIKSGDNVRRFFEAAWVHKHQGTYYLSYSTGDTHLIQYATSDSPYGPFVFRGTVLKPVLGWTNHHSIVQSQGKWWLFYHDSSLSGGKTHLRSIKMTEIVHNKDGSITTVDAYFGDD